MTQVMENVGEKWLWVREGPRPFLLHVTRERREVQVGGALTRTADHRGPADPRGGAA